ncbi:IS4 family transposase [Azospirillum griseum]|uniref:IS4 family transposase n=1 Tax=Azospirillum griseum TaxID=2496639 RepID=UPI001315997F|nr:IS4 family transposase [Azospirillum griseum]
MDEEIAEGQLPDKRLDRRLRQVFDQIGGAMGQTIPRACQDWANTKAAYRFFSNGRVSEHAILKGHFEATCDRVAAADGPILVLQDTTEFTYQREKPERIGFTKSVNSGKDKADRLRHHAVCGLLMHSSLAVTTQGVPLGLAAVKFWTRDKFKGAAALKRKINPTRVPIETKESYRWLENLRQSNSLLGDPGRCVHVGDRESDICELFCIATELGTSFLVRAQTDRLADDGGHTVAAELADEVVCASHVVELHNDKGEAVPVTLDVKFRTIDVLPPIGKQKKYPALKLTYIHAYERDEPADRPRVSWKLITNLPVRTAQEAVEKLGWYALRWKIEVFHKIMKSGCKAEDVKLRTAERLVNLLAVFCILSWRIF